MQDQLYYSKDHEWLDKEGTIGITAFAAGELGDIVYLDFPSLGTMFRAGEVFGTIEAVKTVSDLFMPVSGTILEVNELILDRPELVNTDPFGAGWLVKIRLNDPVEVDALMDQAAYNQLTGR